MLAKNKQTNKQTNKQKTQPTKQTNKTNSNNNNNKKPKQTIISHTQRIYIKQKGHTRLRRKQLSGPIKNRLRFCGYPRLYLGEAGEEEEEKNTEEKKEECISVGGLGVWGGVLCLSYINTGISHCLTRCMYLDFPRKYLLFHRICTTFTQNARARAHIHLSLIHI